MAGRNSHDETGKGQSFLWKVGRSPEAGGIGRRHEQCRTNAVGTDQTGADCGKATKAVSNDPYLPAVGIDGLAHACRPFGKTGPLPVGLFNPPGTGEPAFQPGLPMAWPAVAQTWHDEDGLHGFASYERPAFPLIVALARRDGRWSTSAASDTPPAVPKRLVGRRMFSKIVISRHHFVVHVLSLFRSGQSRPARRP